MITVGGFFANSRRRCSPPRIPMSSSLTICTTCCAGFSALLTSSPRARSRTFAVKSLTTGSATSASSSARRISRTVPSTSDADSLPFVRRLRKVSVSRSESVPKVAMVLQFYASRPGARRRARSAPVQIGDARQGVLQLGERRAVTGAPLGPHPERRQHDDGICGAEHVGTDALDPGVAGSLGQRRREPSLTQRRLALQLLLEAHRPGVPERQRQRIRLEPLQDRRQHGLDAVRIRARTRLGESLHGAVQALVEARPEHIALGGEVVEEARATHARPLGDAGDRGALVTLLEEQLAGGLGDRLARGDAGAADAAGGGAHHATVSRGAPVPSRPYY
ncbi:exported hypothetical protein [Microbacterium sp. 8M]|nr:exported hypothetical protein [Microbacterium sp. 8M]